MRLQFPVELGRTFFREEDAGRGHVDAFACSRYRLFQPMRPLRVEVNVIRRSGNQRGCLHVLKFSFDIDRVMAVESVDESLDIARALR